MGLYKYLKNIWKKPKETNKEGYRELLLDIRKEPATRRLERPTRLDRARSLGYRAKQGIFVVRQRVTKGGHRRPKIKKGRRSAHSGQTMALNKNYKLIAEERVARKYKNCEVLNSYNLCEDGVNKWFEVIMVDKTHPSIKNDKQLAWIAKPRHTGRVHRGKTSAGRKGRALHKKGKGTEKARPSSRANSRKQ
ncbi:MAG: 50S ribosomal protein L15e [Candidatus Woesearchaeota archaeon]